MDKKFGGDFPGSGRLINRIVEKLDGPGMTTGKKVYKAKVHKLRWQAPVRILINQAACGIFSLGDRTRAAGLHFLFIGIAFIM